MFTLRSQSNKTGIEYIMATCTVSSECMNGGRCVHNADEADFYQPVTSAGRYHTTGTCVCMTGFTGPYCESGSQNGSCKRDSECRNGGSCRIQNGQRNEDRSDFWQPSRPSREDAYCVCVDGYTGSKCEVNQLDFRTADKPMEGKQVAGVSVGVLIAIALIGYALVKFVGERARGGGRISAASAGIGRRRGTIATETTIEFSPAFSRNSGEMM
jgi:hypothetical protein